jgi:DNA polymerase
MNSYDKFENEKSACRKCPVGMVYDKVVLSDGCKTNPKLMVIGEAPGADEVEQGKPFIGKAGKLIRSTIQDFGCNETNTLISNVIPCRPEKNKFPKDKTIVTNCFEMWLKREIELTKPNCLLLLGAQPLLFILGLKGITKMRGNLYNLPWNEEIQCMPTFHPSYVQRKQYMKEGPTISEAFREDIRNVAIHSGVLKHENSMY